MTVGDGDVFLVPRGYHGPCVAPPEYAMYYLNVLAGPERAPDPSAFSDDPALRLDPADAGAAWSRDPRVPLVAPAGAVR